MEYIWDITPLAAPGERYRSDVLLKYPGHHPAVWQALANRGIFSHREIRQFLEPGYDGLFHDPFAFRQMEEAVELIIRHIKSGSIIAIFGDYDADGITAAALLSETLEILKGRTIVHIPHRAEEGYGLNRDAVSALCNAGASLLITVDNGIRSAGDIAYAKGLGMDTIITDHHLPAESADQMPAGPIINPAVDGETYPYARLAGAGVAFKLAQAVISRSNLPEELKARIGERILDLAAIGTVADCVSLLGENRTIVKQGLGSINKAKRLGLRELIRAAGIDPAERELDAWNIAFQLAPRINAAGRIDRARLSYELLRSSEQVRAGELASLLSERNSERQEITESLVRFIEEEVLPGQKHDLAVVAVSPEGRSEWHEGVLGLVAGRVAEAHYRPVLVITRSKGVLKGSGRSIPEFNITKALEDCSHYLLKFGGHPQACGFSLEEQRLADFTRAFKESAAKELSGRELNRRLEIDAPLPLAEIDERLSDALAGFAPFGQDNGRPAFASAGTVVAERREMGNEGRHLKLRLSDPNGEIRTAVGFYQSERFSHVRPGDRVDIAYSLDTNEWNGRREAQLRIIDIKVRNDK